MHIGRPLHTGKSDLGPTDIAGCGLLGIVGGRETNRTKVRFCEGPNPATLIVVNAAKPASDATETWSLLVAERKPVLILVEDDPSVLRALRRLMVSAGFEVRAFDRPRVLLAGRMPKSNACLIVDVHLPEMTGVELCEVLAAGGCRLPVIMITGHQDQATAELMRRADPVAILFKPFSREALLAAISKALTAATRV